MNSFIICITSDNFDNRLIDWSVEDFLPSDVYSVDIGTINNYSSPRLNLSIHSSILSASSTSHSCVVFLVHLPSPACQERCARVSLYLCHCIQLTMTSAVMMLKLHSSAIRIIEQCYVSQQIAFCQSCMLLFRNCCWWKPRSAHAHSGAPPQCSALCSSSTLQCFCALNID